MYFLCLQSLDLEDLKLKAEFLKSMLSFQSVHQGLAKLQQLLPGFFYALSILTCGQIYHDNSTLIVSVQFDKLRTGNLEFDTPPSSKILVKRSSGDLDNFGERDCSPSDCVDFCFVAMAVRASSSSWGMQQDLGRLFFVVMKVVQTVDGDFSLYRADSQEGQRAQISTTR